MFNLNMVDGIVGAVKTLAAPIVDHFKHKREMKEMERKTDLDIQKAKAQSALHMVEQGQDYSQVWETKSIDNSGWKDEYWTIIISVPLILCFVPGMDVYVVQGFKALHGTPDWYRWAVGIAIGSAFGVRKITQAVKKWKK